MPRFCWFLVSPTHPLTPKRGPPVSTVSPQHAAASFFVACDTPSLTHTHTSITGLLNRAAVLPKGEKAPQAEREGVVGTTSASASHLRLPLRCQPPGATAAAVLHTGKVSLIATNPEQALLRRRAAVPREAEAACGCKQLHVAIST